MWGWWTTKQSPAKLREEPIDSFVAVAPAPPSMEFPKPINNLSPSVTHPSVAATDNVSSTNVSMNAQSNTHPSSVEITKQTDKPQVVENMVMVKSKSQEPDKKENKDLSVASKICSDNFIGRVHIDIEAIQMLGKEFYVKECEYNRITRELKRLRQIENVMMNPVDHPYSTAENVPGGIDEITAAITKLTVDSDAALAEFNKVQSRLGNMKSVLLIWFSKQLDLMIHAGHRKEQTFIWVVHHNYPYKETVALQRCRVLSLFEEVEAFMGISFEPVNGKMLKSDKSVIWVTQYQSKQDPTMIYMFPSPVGDMVERDLIKLLFRSTGSGFYKHISFIE